MKIKNRIEVVASSIGWVAGSYFSFEVDLTALLVTFFKGLIRVYMSGPSGARDTMYHPSRACLRALATLHALRHDLAPEALRARVRT